MSIQIDPKVLQLCRKGDKDAFSELFKKYEKYLYNLCMGYVGNKSDALDLVQEVLIKVFVNFDKYNIDRPFHPWIRKVAVNTCLNFKKIKKNVISLNAVVQDNMTIEGVIADSDDLDMEI